MSLEEIMATGDELFFAKKAIELRLDLLQRLYDAGRLK